MTSEPLPRSCLPDPVFPLQVICTDRQPASTLPKHSRAGVQDCQALDMWPLTLGASKPGSMAGGQHRLLLGREGSTQEPPWAPGQVGGDGGSPDLSICPGGSANKDSVNQKPIPFYMDPLDLFQTKLLPELLKDKPVQERLQILGIYNRAACSPLSILVLFRGASWL